jgi:hypothetical protein
MIARCAGAGPLPWIGRCKLAAPSDRRAGRAAVVPAEPGSYSGMSLSSAADWASST